MKKSPLKLGRGIDSLSLPRKHDAANPQNSLKTSKEIPVKLDEESFEIIEWAKKYFIHVFNRNPCGDDPVFIVNYLFSEQDTKREMETIMRRQGVDPALIYAFKKTGLIVVSEDGYKNLSAKNLKQWNKAIDDYHSKRIKKSKYEIAFESLYDELPSCLIAFGLFLEKEINKPDSKNCQHEFYKYVYFCAVRTFKTFKSILYLLKEEVGDDVLLLCRSLYENYINIIHIKKNPAYIQNLHAQAGLKQGTHEYKKNSTGKVDRRKIIDKCTLKEYEVINNYKKASSSPYSEDEKLYDHVYSYLSSYIHPDMNVITNYLKEGSYSYHLSSDLENSVQYVVFIALLVLDQLILLEGISHQTQQDLITVICRVRKILLHFIKLNNLRSSEQKKTLISRIKLLGKPPVK